MYVYMNLEAQAIGVRDEYGVPFTIPCKGIVKGDFYARYAKPGGPLSMVHEDRIDPSDIVRVGKPKNERVEGSWRELLKRVDPMLIHLPERVVAAVATPTPFHHTTDCYLGTDAAECHPACEFAVTTEEPDIEISPEQEVREDETETGPVCEDTVDETPTRQVAPAKSKKAKTKRRKRAASNS